MWMKWRAKRRVLEERRGRGAIIVFASWSCVIAREAVSVRCGCVCLQYCCANVTVYS